MRNFKYVIINDIYPVVFGEYFQHSDVVARLNNPNVTSAGFGALYIDDQGRIQISCYGESTSLEKKAGKYDATIIRGVFVDPMLDN